VRKTVENEHAQRVFLGSRLQNSLHPIKHLKEILGPSHQLFSKMHYLERYARAGEMK
jgi:hypothetical protein